MNKSSSFSCHNNKCNDNNSNDYKINSCNNNDICFKYIICAQGQTGPRGPIGPTGPAGGPTGPTGATGPAGGVLNFADFYALMPPDNAATVAPGTDVSFPQDGPNSGSGISRIGADSFNLGNIGTYQVLFQVGTNEAGQLVLT